MHLTSKNYLWNEPQSFFPLAFSCEITAIFNYSSSKFVLPSYTKSLRFGLILTDLQETTLLNKFVVIHFTCSKFFFVIVHKIAFIRPGASLGKPNERTKTFSKCRKRWNDYCDGNLHLHGNFGLSYMQGGLRRKHHFKSTRNSVRIITIRYSTSKNTSTEKHDCRQRMTKQNNSVLSKTLFFDF
jgi:hypothetical protein